MGEHVILNMNYIVKLESWQILVLHSLIHRKGCSPED